MPGWWRRWLRLISLFLLVTVELDRPYSGDIRVDPEQFRAVLEQFAPETAAGVVAIRSDLTSGRRLGQLRGK